MAWIVRIVGRRLRQMLVVLVGVSVLTFLMLNLLPGDPAVATLGPDASEQSLQRFRDEHDLDDPLMARYLSWAGDAMTGDLGTSFKNDRDVRATIVDRLPVSVELIVVSQVLAVGSAIATALLSVWHRDRFLDRLNGFVAVTSLSVPPFLLAFVLILVFAVRLGWFPATGFTRLSDGIGENLRSILLPAASLAATRYAVYMRLLRSEMLATLDEDYLTTARGKGLRTGRILVRHVLRNSMMSLVTVVGISTGAMLGGAVIIETIFSLPGVGRLLIEGITTRDLMMVQGLVLVVAVAFVCINLVVDLLYLSLDPKVRDGNLGT